MLFWIVQNGRKLERTKSGKINSLFLRGRSTELRRPESGKIYPSRSNVYGGNAYVGEELIGSALIGSYLGALPACMDQKSRSACLPRPQLPARFPFFRGRAAVR